MAEGSCYAQAGQPMGQVVWPALGVMHFGYSDEGPPCSTMQHSWLSVQNVLPQQNCPVGGCFCTSHGGALQAVPPGA